MKSRGAGAQFPHCKPTREVKRCGARFPHRVPTWAFVFPHACRLNHSPTHLLIPSPHPSCFLLSTSSISTILRAVAVVLYWLIVKLIVNPVEGLLWVNGWQAELRLTVRLTFSTDSRGEIFDCAIPVWVQFLQELPVCNVVAQITDMDATELV
ncbi:hypothetical protein EI94DRAFT_1802298 [Lactarius quietus]|nr:hypothetical protein EI94DRAFT_1802298 [Lactarius quietus]